VPLTRQTRFPSDVGMTARLAQACKEFLALDLPLEISSADRDSFRLVDPRLHQGLIASADEFVHGPDRAAQLNTLLPGLLAVEMEGAAVAQVCYEFGVPFAVIRTISDEANAQSAVDFLRFVDRIASQYALHVVRRYCLAA
jgi:adenosylhomocysteine nucleosidase